MLYLLLAIFFIVAFLHCDNNCVVMAAIITIIFLIVIRAKKVDR